MALLIAFRMRPGRGSPYNPGSGIHARTARAAARVPNP
jgi:hypothetical protein